ncbi:MAG: hypothetical protein HYX51_06490 [Chloroflexi bacterium]|nr:hypothetical protein [Chloroflexota bacterium]
MGPPWSPNAHGAAESAGLTCSKIGANVARFASSHQEVPRCPLPAARCPLPAARHKVPAGAGGRGIVAVGAHGRGVEGVGGEQPRDCCLDGFELGSVRVLDIVVAEDGDEGVAGGVVGGGGVAGEGERAALPDCAVEVDQQMVGDVGPAPFWAGVERLDDPQVGGRRWVAVPSRRAGVMERHPLDGVWPHARARRRGIPGVAPAHEPRQIRAVIRTGNPTARPDRTGEQR